jgi:16S rRNA U1498 N3-methylase RsmE
VNLIVFSPEEWGQSLPADDERAVHIREVLRLAPGDAFRVGLLDQGAGQAVYRGLADGRALLDWPDRSALFPDAGPLPITVLLGQPRPPVMQRLLKDLGALGVARILVVSSELSEKSYMQSRLWIGHQSADPAGAGDRAASGGSGIWRNHLVAGAQQGGHCFLSRVERYYSVKKAIEALEGQAAPGTAEALPLAYSHRRLVLDLEPGAPSFLGRCAGVAADSGGDWCLAIGPERGWTDRERGLFRDSGFAAFALGPRILRTETATILATGMLTLALSEAR